MKKCLCGRKSIEEFEINKGKKIYLCPFCSFLLMRQHIMRVYGENKYRKILDIMNDDSHLKRFLRGRQ